MALINCKECEKEISDKAGTYFLCGVLLKPKLYMWLWLILFIVVISVFSSKNSNATDSSNKSNIQKLVEEAKVLYLELMKFKNDKEFHEVGFDSCCSYNKWLLKAEALRDNPNGMDLMFEGFFPGDIEKLGQAYYLSKGKETEYTKKETRKFRQIFNLLKENEYKPNSNEALKGVKNFEKLSFLASPQLINLISYFDISYSDGHLIVNVKQPFLNMEKKSQKKIYNAIIDLWKSTNLVKEKHYGDWGEVKYLDISTGETKTIKF